MEKFLESVAADLWQRYGNDVEKLQIILPNVRTRVFLVDALSRVASHPIWSPRYLSIDSLMCELAGMERLDTISAITQLYKVYSSQPSHTGEKFDSFYRWGEVLLGDFDSVDKYLIDAKMLFCNMVELKELEADLNAYMDSEQIDAVRRFWREFDSSRKSSEHKQAFLSVWNSLLPVYREYRTMLEAQGVGYTGMIYRRAAERLRSGEVELPEGRYVVVGFNALSASEKELFNHLKKQHSADFYWDYDDYYIGDVKQEAGLFLRQNIKDYPSSATFATQSYFSQPKQIRVVSTASDSLQCKYVGEWIEQIVERDGKIDKNTAIVLTDEGLLSPLLYSLPDSVGKVNVTMGYPLKATLAYSFVERVLQLQLRVKQSRSGKQAFYHSDVIGLLGHPYVVATDPKVCEQLRRDILRRGRIYVGRDVLLGHHEFLDTLFSDHHNWGALKEYLLDVVGRVVELAIPHQSNDQRLQLHESVALIRESIVKLDNSLCRCNVEMELKTYVALLRRVLQSVRIPYSGAPLRGVQIMGILETRNLDFNNVVVLSMNDDNFPSGRINDNSLIPYNLRYAYGLPTPRHNEGVYAYYFYRLIQRATMVDLVYCSVAGEKASGENSRYIYQLEFESPHTIERLEKSLNMSLTENPPLRVPKQGAVLRKLMSYVGGNGEEPQRRLSPSALNMYLSCSLKFYFAAIAGMKVIDDEIEEEVDNALFGTLFHKAMELLYKPIAEKQMEPKKYISSLTDEQIHKAVIDAITEDYFKGDSVPEEEYGGQLIVVCDTVEKYIRNFVLPYDSAPDRGSYGVYKLEYPLQADVPFGGGYVRFYGEADRIDSLPDGSLRVIDYKTGGEHLSFDGLAALTADDTSKHSGAVLQTLIYSLMVDDLQRRGELKGRGVTPALYYVRYMGREGYSPLLDDKSKGEPVGSYADYADEFRELLRGTLDRLFDPDVPFEATEQSRSCQWCDFADICRR
ncbi:MAG: PD-(D/E)XK nuclease family protein [Tidjanibacter sp.]|nr:PD-(D/E)XK nuclease family protein [Tidjanibacter sp.]